MRLSLALVAALASTAAAGTFRAAVVQHVQVPTTGSASRDLLLNLKIFAADAMQAASQGAQIIVFPEFGAFSGDWENLCTKPQDAIAICEPYPSPDPSVVPCLAPASFAPSLVAASCAARNASIYLSANLCDHQPEGNYNAQLVFDATGALVAKYFKVHPWYSNCFLDGADDSSNYVSFTTSFGARIGIFTCFDIAFASPSTNLLAEGINLFSYSSSIATVGATVTSLWSSVHNATLLSSNLGEGQSGLFSRGTRTTATPGQGEQIVIGDVEF